jgi:hypothetical protein
MSYLGFLVFVIQSSPRAPQNQSESGERERVFVFNQLRARILFLFLRTAVALRFIDSRASSRFTQGDVCVLCAEVEKWGRAAAPFLHLFFCGQAVILRTRTKRVAQDLFGALLFQLICCCPSRIRRTLGSITLLLPKTYLKNGVNFFKP